MPFEKSRSVKQSTKSKIRDAALQLFNKEGMVNVRLQHIADEAFVSVGNLAYHYPNKEAILLALYRELTQKQQELLAEYRIVPLFDNIDRLIHHTYLLQRTYLFFYADTLEITRAYPEIGAAHKEHIQFQLAQISQIIEFNVARGVFVADIPQKNKERLSRQVWMTMDFWVSQELVCLGKLPEPEDYRMAVWNLYRPYFTGMGRREYEQMLQMPYDFFF